MSEQDVQGTTNAVADLWARVYGPEPLKVKVLVARSRAAAARLNMEPPAPRPGDLEKVELAVALLKAVGESKRLNPEAIGWWLRKHPSRWERLPGRDTRWRVLHALEARPSSLDLDRKPKPEARPALCGSGLHPRDPGVPLGLWRCAECAAAKAERRKATLKLDQTKCRLGKHEGHPRVKCKACAASRASRRALRQRARVLKDREMGLTPAKKRASRSYGMLGYK